MQSRWKGNDQEPIQSPMGEDYEHIPRQQVWQAHTESKVDISFPGDGHQTILNKANKKSKTNRKTDKL